MPSPRKSSRASSRRSRSSGGTPRWAIILLSVVTIGVVGLAGTAVVMSSTRANEEHGTAMTFPDPPEPVTVAVIGDSWGAGAGTDLGTEEASFVAVAIRTDGGKPWMMAEGATGYTVDSTWGPRYGDRLPLVVEAAPDLVIVQGGVNDVTSDLDDVRQAATDFYAGLAAELPDTRVIVVGPMTAINSDPAGIQSVSTAISEAAAAAGLTFVDPLAGGWLPLDPTLFSDGWHPNQTGTDLISARLADELKPIIEDAETKKAAAVAAAL